MSLSMEFAKCLEGISPSLVLFKPKFSNVQYPDQQWRKCLISEQGIRERLEKPNFDFSHEFFISEKELIRALGAVKEQQLLGVVPK